MNKEIDYLAQFLPELKNEVENTINPDKILTAFDFDFPNIIEGIQPRYLRDEDIIEMPPKHTYENEYMYYRVLFHELAHSTQQQNRVGRKYYPSPFGGYDYCIEELLADFTAILMCKKTGILQHTYQSHSIYIQKWYKMLLINSWGNINKNHLNYTIEQARKITNLI